MNSRPHSRPPHLRLFQPDDSGTGELVSSAMTLSQFFSGWFLENVLRTQERAEATATLYRESLAWWREITGDPPICRITQALVNEFRDQLRVVTYRRGLASPLRRLGEATVSKHLRTIRSLLKACGPQEKPMRPAAELLDRVPMVYVKPTKENPKDCFTSAQVRQLVEASQSLPGEAAPGVPMRTFWAAAYCTFFYTGVRRQTGLLLRRNWLRQRKGQWWLDILDEAVPKTDKGKLIVVHSTLLAACEKIWSTCSDPRLLPWNFTADHLLDMHYEIQTLAGIPEAEQLDIQGLRRTFANEMFLLGADVGLKIAQESLDHADSRTTLGHYVTYNRLIPRLPAIWSAEREINQKLLF